MPESNVAQVADWALVVLTLGLLCVTAWYAKSTKDILKATQDVVQANQDLVAATTESLLLEVVPLVIAVSGGASWNGDRGSLKVVGQNTGKGPAINVKLSVEIVGKWEESRPTQHTIEPGKEASVTIAVNNSEEAKMIREGRVQLVYHAEYEDIYGNQFQTRRRADGQLDFSRTGRSGGRISFNLSERSNS